MSEGTRVLVIDDEPSIRRFLRTALRGQGYTLIEAETARQGLEAARLEHPDIIVLDLGLPDMDGMDVIRRLRQSSLVPIVVLTVRTGDQEKVQALDLGADDFVVKPFSINELLARMRTALRHRLQEQGTPAVYQSGELLVDSVRRLVQAQGKEVHLSPTEYALLDYLVRHSGRVVTHQQILREVWGPAYLAEVQYLRVYVRQLRQKLEPDPTQPRYILTEPGVGYRMAE